MQLTSEFKPAISQVMIISDDIYSLMLPSVLNRAANDKLLNSSVNPYLIIVWDYSGLVYPSECLHIFLSLSYSWIIGILQMSEWLNQMTKHYNKKQPVPIYLKKIYI